MLVYEGEALSLWELRYEIEQERRMTSGDYDLLFYDGESGEKIEDENLRIEKNSRIIVERIPLTGINGPLLNRNKSSSQKVPPENYVCYRCGEKGHFIQHCPHKNDNVYKGPNSNRTFGIPKYQVDANNTKKEWDRQTNKFKYKNVPEEFKCSECLGILENAVGASCRHLYCEKCILVGERCPTCRKTIMHAKRIEEMDEKILIYKSRNDIE